MKTKLMLGLAAVSLLASCGLIKTPQIAIGADTTKSVVAGSGVGGGALGIDGKGAPLDLSKDRIVLQGVNSNVLIADGTFADDTSADTQANIGRLAEWGATQTMPLATLAPGLTKSCPASFQLTSVSFVLTIKDPTNTTGVSHTVSFSAVDFKQKGTTCDYDITVNGQEAFVQFVLASQKATDFGKILTSGGINTAALTGNYTAPASVETGKLTIKFGGSKAYIVANII